MSHTRKLMFGSLCVVLVFALGIAIAAQTVTGSISGLITDANGGIVPGATVTIISEKDGGMRRTVTNEEGHFQFSTVQPGPYTIKIEANGFQTLQRTNTILTASENL